VLESVSRPDRLGDRPPGDARNNRRPSENEAGQGGGERSSEREGRDVGFKEQDDGAGMAVSRDTKRWRRARGGFLPTRPWPHGPRTPPATVPGGGITLRSTRREVGGDPGQALRHRSPPLQLKRHRNIGREVRVEGQMRRSPPVSGSGVASRINVETASPETRQRALQ